MEIKYNVHVQSLLLHKLLVGNNHCCFEEGLEGWIFLNVPLF